MKKLLLVGCLLPGLAFAANPPSVTQGVLDYYWDGTATIAVSPTNPLPVSASVSASISGFTAASTGTPISVTTGGVTGNLPTGAVVVASNTGSTNAAYCKLGASATTSDQYIAPGGGWFAFTVGASTQLTCITSASTTTVNMVGGAGLPTGVAGNGVPAGGATAANQATEIASLATIATNTGAAIPAGSALIGKVGVDQTTPGTTNGVAIVGVNAATALAGNGVTGTGSQRVTVASDNTPFPVKIDQTTDGTTNAVRQTTQYPSGAVAETASATGTTGATTATLATNSGQTTFICGFSIRANATAAATNNATVTGTITATMNFTQWTAPLASGLGVTEMIFTPCVPASGTNQAIAVVSGAPGSGGVVSVSAWGFLK